eukprot:4899793-Pleurochrysis_carterae.AAC.1
MPPSGWPFESNNALSLPSSDSSPLEYAVLILLSAKLCAPSTNRKMNRSAWKYSGKEERAELRAGNTPCPCQRPPPSMSSAVPAR